MNVESASPVGCVVEARGLEKTFGENRALAGIDLEVAGGECLVIFGPNGAGKTTLLKVLSTLMKPNAGTISLFGADVRAEPVRVRRMLSLVSHETFLYDNLTLYENLKFYGKMYDVPDVERRIREVTAWVQLESRLHDRTGTFSRGLQQRASFARAILHKPSLLFLDEPDIGLDPRASKIVDEVIGSVGRDHRTVVMTTHNLERGMELASSIVVLRDGKVVYRASGEALKKDNIRNIYDRYTEKG
jgi:heme exporter protein A